MCLYTGHVHLKETYAPRVADPLTSLVNDSTPMHMIECGASTSGALPQKVI